MKNAAPNIGFADASFKSCEMSDWGPSDRNLTVYLTSWDDKIIEISFLNILEFAYKIGSIVSGLYEIPEETSMLKEAISLHFETPPEKHNFKTYTIIDIEDFEFFTVVAEDVSVIKK